MQSISRAQILIMGSYLGYARANPDVIKVSWPSCDMHPALQKNDFLNTSERSSVLSHWDILLQMATWAAYLQIKHLAVTEHYTQVESKRFHLI